MTDSRPARTFQEARNAGHWPPNDSQPTGTQLADELTTVRDELAEARQDVVALSRALVQSGADLRRADFDLTAEQAKPIPTGAPSVQGMVRADLETRELIGIERYGTPLQPHNGRDALRDAYEEALDLACYLRQAIAERDA